MLFPLHLMALVAESSLLPFRGRMARRGAEVVTSGTEVAGSLLAGDLAGWEVALDAEAGVGHFRTDLVCRVRAGVEAVTEAAVGGLPIEFDRMARSRSGHMCGVELMAEDAEAGLFRGVAALG